MDEQVKEIVEVDKPVSLMVVLNRKAHENLKKQQKTFRKRTGGRISLKDLSSKLLETASL